VRLPKPNILRPWPQDRFASRIRGGSPVHAARRVSCRERGVARVPTAKGEESPSLLCSDEAHMEADLWPGSHNKLIIRSKCTCATDDKPRHLGAFLTPRWAKNRHDFRRDSASSRGLGSLCDGPPRTRARRCQEAKISGEFARIAANLVVPNWERSPGQKRRKIAGAGCQEAIKDEGVESCIDGRYGVQAEKPPPCGVAG
jgi:hypothetical protein